MKEEILPAYWRVRPFAEHIHPASPLQATSIPGRQPGGCRSDFWAIEAMLTGSE